jgi:outer membrane protein, heavy metal efflux system
MYSFALLALFAWLQADAMTLPQVEAEAIANNPEIRSLEQQVRIAETRVTTATAIEDPEFEYRAWGTPLLSPWNMNQTQHMFMFSQKVPSRSKRELRYLIASDDAEIQSLAVDAKKTEVAGMVRRAFHQLLRTYDQLRLHHEQVALAEQGVGAARVKYTVGKVPQQDVLKAQIAYSRLVEHDLMFQREAEMARAELNTLMGRPPDQSLEVTGEYRVLQQLPSQSELQEMAIENRPELRALNLMKRQGGRKVQLAEKAFKPDYTITAGYMLMPGGSMNRNAWMGELSVSLPWLNRGTHDAEIRVAQTETAAIDAEYRKELTAIAREIREAVIEIESSRKVVELYRDTLRPQAISTLRATAAAYQTDQTDFLNLLDSQSMAIDFQHAFFTALETYEKSVAALERAVGRSLW